MNEKERRELISLGLDPSVIAQRAYNPEKRWNPADYIGSMPLTQDPNQALIESQESVMGKANLSPEEERALKQAFLTKVMSR